MSTTSSQLESAAFHEEVARALADGKLDDLSRRMARDVVGMLAEAEEKRQLREQRGDSELPRELGVEFQGGPFEKPAWAGTYGGFDDEVTAEPSRKTSGPCLPGKHYADHEDEVDFIQDNLVKIPFGKEGDDRFKYVGDTGMEKWARGVMVQRLVALVDKVRQYYDEKHGVDHVPPMPVESGYRRLGTTVIGGTTAEGRSDDICGELDSRDKFGHWRGLAVDMPTKDWRELDCFNQCGVELPLAVFDNLGRQARLHRAFKNTIDKTHWTMVERTGPTAEIPDYLRIR